MSFLMTTKPCEAKEKLTVGTPLINSLSLGVEIIFFTCFIVLSIMVGKSFEV